VDKSPLVSDYFKSNLFDLYIQINNILDQQVLSFGLLREIFNKNIFFKLNLGARAVYGTPFSVLGIQQFVGWVVLGIIALFFCTFASLPTSRFRHLLIILILVLKILKIPIVIEEKQGNSCCILSKFHKST